MRIFSSVIALMLVSGAAVAAPPAPAPFAPWTIYVEGGAFWDAGPPNVLAGFGSGSKVTGQGAAGFDYRFDALWHVSAQFRYFTGKQNSTPGDLNFFVTPGLCNNNSNVCAAGIGNSSLSVEHRGFTADASIGRDVILGGSNAQAKLGFRYAEVTMTSTASTSTGAIGFAAGVLGPTSSLSLVVQGNSAAISTVNVSNAIANVVAPVGFMTFASQFSGVGPRASVEGDLVIGRGWAIDYMAGGAVLFGQRKISLTTNVPAFGGTLTSESVVFNMDGSAGLSYWLTPGLKATAGYRVDAYFDALPIGNVASGKADYINHGPFGRLTAKF